MLLEYLQSALSHRFLRQSVMTSKKHSNELITGWQQHPNGNTSASGGLRFLARKRMGKTLYLKNMGTEDLENQAAEITKAPWPLGRQPRTLLHLPQAASPPWHAQYNRSEAPGCSQASCNRYRNSSISLKSVCQQRRRCKNTVWELTKPALSYRNADSHNHLHTGSSTIFSTRRGGSHQWRACSL